MDVRLTGGRDEVSRALRLIRTVLAVEDVTGYTTARFDYPSVHLTARASLPADPWPERSEKADEDEEGDGS